MGKCLCFVLCLFGSYFSGFSQTSQTRKQETANPQKDRMEYRGYTIVLLPAIGKTYGYAILKEKKLLVRQMYHPFTMSPVGLRNKEDVYKVAKWQVEQLIATGNPRTDIIQNTKPFSDSPNVAPHLQNRSFSANGYLSPSINQRLPRKLAQELGIRLNN